MGKVHLKANFFLLFAATHFLGVLALFLPGLFVVYFIGLALFLLVSIFDIRRLLITRPLKIHHRCPSVLELNQNSSFRIDAQIQGDPSCRFTLLLKSLDDLCVLGKKDCERSLSGELQCEIPIIGKKLGVRRLTHLSFQIDSPLRMLGKEVDVRILPHRIRVIPSRRSKSPEELVHQIKRSGAMNLGKRLIMSSRASGQTQGMRPYRYPDPLKTVDQKKSAKLGQLMTREYEEIFEHQLIIGVDCGRQMLGEIAGSRKMDFYTAAALHLTENALQSGDRVGFFSFASETRLCLPLSRNRPDFASLYDSHPMLEPLPVSSDFSRLLETSLQLTHKRSLFILLSDMSKPSLQDEILEILPNLSRRHLCFILSLHDPKWDSAALVEQLNINQMSTAEFRKVFYATRMSRKSEDFFSKARRQGAYFVQSSYDNWLGLVRQVYQMARLSTRLG